MYLYLTTNTRRSEPACLKSVSYVHVKARGDGDQTVVLTEEPITDDALQPLTKEKAQAQLNAWADAENEAETQEGIVHEAVNLSAMGYVGMWEQAKVHRIARGFFTGEEAATFATREAIRAAYPRLTGGWGQVELDLLFEKMARIVGGTGCL